MSSVLDYMQLCRLCLVKDKVNVPIFGESSDVGQIFFKITACLPIKVSQNDNLPKKICDTCLYKVDLLYQFWNTTVNAEKQLLQWLGEIGVEVNLKKSEQSSANHTNQHSIQDEPLVLKEERNEADAPSADAVQQPFTSSKPVAFKSYDQLTETNIKAADIREDAVEETSLSSSTNVQLKPEVSEKRLRSRTAAIKKEEIHIKTTSTNNNSSADEPMDEDSSEKLISQEESDSSMDAGERIAKEEAESEEEYEDTAESLEPTAFVGVPSDSACDTDQPGPSGLNKPVTSTDTGHETPMSTAFSYIKVVNENSLKSQTLACDICSKLLKTKQCLYHRRELHSGKTHQCDICMKIFPKRWRLVSHKKQVHLEKNFACDTCDKLFAFKSGLVFHIKKAHDKDYKIFCKECNKGFFAIGAYKEHYKVNHEGVRYICFPCNKTMKDIQHFKKHMEMHNPESKGYNCKECGIFYDSLVNFRAHIQRRHKNKTPHVCDVCGKEITSAAGLKAHKRTHTGEKPFICDTCGKAFNKKTLLVLHIRVHTKEKPFQCSVCEQSFSQRSSLTTHIRSHTGEKPYSCTFCDSKFVLKYLLKKHMQSQHGTALADL